MAGLREEVSRFRNSMLAKEAHVWLYVESHPILSTLACTVIASLGHPGYLHSRLLICILSEIVVFWKQGTIVCSLQTQNRLFLLLTKLQNADISSRTLSCIDEMQLYWCDCEAVCYPVILCT